MSYLLQSLLKLAVFSNLSARKEILNIAPLFIRGSLGKQNFFWISGSQVEIPHYKDMMVSLRICTSIHISHKKIEEIT